MTDGIILSIDATDLLGHAGVNAAMATSARLGAHARTAVTGVGVRTEDQTLGIYPVSGAVVSDQIRAALTSSTVGAILIGLLPTREIVDAVGDALEKLDKRPPLIVDPILASRDGKKFLDKAAVDALKRRILVMADLLMPNIPEAEGLTGLSVHDEATMEHAAEMLLTFGPRNVFLKGNTLTLDQTYEIYVDERRTQVFTGERYAERPLYGAGAILASAVSIYIARGSTPRQAVTDARGYLENLIKNLPGAETGQ